MDPFQAVVLQARCGIDKQLGVLGNDVKDVERLPGAKSPRSSTNEGRRATVEAGGIKPVVCHARRDLGDGTGKNLEEGRN